MVHFAGTLPRRQALRVCPQRSRLSVGFAALTEVEMEGPEAWSRTVWSSRHSLRLAQPRSPHLNRACHMTILQRQVNKCLGLLYPSVLRGEVCKSKARFCISALLPDDSSPARWL